MKFPRSVAPLLATALTLAFLTASQAAGWLPGPDQFTPDGKAAVTAALERLRQTKVFNHPDYPWVLRARRVEGDTLHFVEILHRNASGAGFDYVAKAVRLTLSFGEGALLAHVRQVDLHGDDLTGFMQDWVLLRPLPAQLREDRFRTFAAAETRLTPEQRKALRADYPLTPEQRTFLATFGELGNDWLPDTIQVSESGRILLAYDCEGVRTEGGTSRFARIAVAVFDKHRNVVQRCQGRDFSAGKADLCDLLADEPHLVTFRGADGTQFEVPAANER